MGTTENEIKEIIKKNLPANVGETLKERLSQAEKDAETVQELRGVLEAKEKLINK